MRNTTIKFQCNEPSFGSSTQVELTVDKKNTILLISDKSTHETNWTWDYVPGFFSQAIGNTVEFFESLVTKHNANLLKGEPYRKPYWCRCV